MFVPLEDADVPELIDYPHYRCKHIIDEEWDQVAWRALANSERKKTGKCMYSNGITK